MTTLSAGAAAGLLVALMAISSSDSQSAELSAAAKQANGFVHPGDARGFNPQPDPPRFLGSGSVKAAIS